ncbi:PH domain-containing protein [Flavobacterium sp.]|jgi:membrane protein YdbS with pleckstrin-like domain|uniref:PH domain-containing protein n=1 Tax=Flavobacterium sp. TaxID=239 RepID=UPI002A807B7C|nr:PH domain-containing protein [Flavobacterium sp.]
MNEFTNKEISISDLPQFEVVQLQPIHPSYYKVILINIGVVFTSLGIGLAVLSYFKEDFFSNRIWMLIGASYTVLLTISLLFSRLSFKYKSYAFREHDAIYKSGVVSQTTTIVPYKRIQHVALHQGLFSRYFGLASLELFTAGGSSTDLEINGLTLEDAQRYKIWIIQKIDTLIEESEEESTIKIDV